MSASHHIPNLHEGPKNMQTTATPGWSLIQGTVQLFISGPGPQAWCACSKPNYEPGSKPGTPQERVIALAALQILIKRHREDKDAGVVHIQDALALATRQHNRQAARVEALTH